MVALREERNTQNAVFCEEILGKNSTLYVYLTYKDIDLFLNGSVHRNNIG